MRKNILAAGGALLALTLVVGFSYPLSLSFMIPISVLNVILGLITRTPPGFGQSQLANVRFVVDRGVVRASIYQLVFTDSKLTFKRLSSVVVTVILPLVLAVVGLAVLFIAGALMGGITGFSLQEFLTQRNRNKIENENQLTSVAQGDIEIAYSDLSEVRLAKNRLYLRTETMSLSASFPRGRSREMSPVLAKIFGTKFTTEESIRASKAADKENEESQHPRGDRGKLSRR
jgi:hypothetical protein